MTQRTAAVSSEGGAPFELISEKPPPITSATKARIPQTSEPLRALLQKKRDCDRSGFDPLEGAFPRPVMARPSRRTGHGCARQRSGGLDGRCGARSDVEEAPDRDGRADG